MASSGQQDPHVTILEQSESCRQFFHVLGISMSLAVALTDTALTDTTATEATIRNRFSRIDQLPAIETSTSWGRPKNSRVTAQYVLAVSLWPTIGLGIATNNRASVLL